MSVDFFVKIILIGEANAGKTTIVERFCKSDLSNLYNPTIGVEFNSSIVEYNDKKVKLQFWDTAGQEVFAPIIKNYYKNVAGLFLVVDLTSSKSISKIGFWLEEYNKNKNDCNYDSNIIIVGNKKESSKRVVGYDDINEICKNKGYEYYEVSALNNENIEEIKEKMLSGIFKNIENGNNLGISGPKTILLSETTNKNDKTCCCMQ